MKFKLDEYDYSLPKELIAQHPAEPRDSSRLMIVGGKHGDTIEHAHFRDILHYLKNDDVLVVNDTRVIPARLYAKKASGGRVEILIVKQVSLPENASGRSEVAWECLAMGKNLRPGTKLTLDGTNLIGTILSRGEKSVISFDCSEPDFWRTLERVGKMPVPPYIHDELKEHEKYQTVYSNAMGAIAAPTAGLHFTNELIAKLSSMGIALARLTLHVGLGTFLPVKSDDIREHKMQSEHFTITNECANAINSAREKGGRIIVVGTTSMRALESAKWEDGKLIPSEGNTELFIFPGYRFKSNADAMLTNFHLPKSTLIMLISAFAGRERVMDAYRVAVKEKYRFYSFGDAMLIFPTKAQGEE